ncbi:MAG: UvrD-helicase domain-containing protein [Myxococcota bacterium]
MTELRVVTASAGTGKTHHLVELVVEQLLSGQVRPEGLVAVTYTRKAADELIGRLRTRLAAAGRVDLAGRLQDGHVGTLHAVCGDLVRQHALILGLSPQVRPLPPIEAARLGREALDDVLARIGPELDPLAARISQPEWRGLVGRILAAARVNGIGGDGLVESARRSVDRLGQCFVPGPPSRDEQLVAELSRIVPALEAEAGSSKAATERFEAARVGLKAARVGALGWREQLGLGKALAIKRIEREHPLLVRLLRDHTDADGLQTDLTTFVHRVFQVAVEAERAFVRRKQEARLLDFDDLLTNARTLLDEPQLTESLTEELDLVVVDEFQDVSPLQLTIVGRMIALAGRGAWVGDEKQAIYRFQGSDPELVRASLAQVDRTETLTHNYRSVPGLVRFCSDLFSAAFAQQGVPAERVRLEAIRPDLSGAPAVERWRWDWAKRSEPDGTVSSPSEARAIAAGVVELLAESPSRVAVLCRTHAGAARVAIALRDRGIAAALDLPGLLDTEEARLVRAGLSVVQDAADGVAATVITWLADLVDDPDRWLGDRLSEVAGWRLRSEAADIAGAPAPPRPLPFDQIPVLRSLRASADRIRLLPPSDQVDAVTEVLGLADWALRRPDPGVRLTNLDALRQIAAGYEQGCEGRHSAPTLSGLLEAFRRVEQDEDGGMQAASPGAEGVVVTTWHGSKGLEWPVVVLAGLDDEPRDDVFGLHVEGPEVFDATDPLAGRWLRLWPWPYGGHGPEAPLGQRAAATPEATAVQGRERAERGRLLYVGFTRARDRLVLAAGEKSGQPVWPWVDELEALAVDGDALIAGGVRHPCRTRSVDPYPQPSLAAPPREARGYPRPAPVTYPAAIVRPSEAGRVAATISEVVKLGPPIAVATPPHRRDGLGDAVHWIFAADRPDLDRVSRVERAGATLAAFEVDEDGLARSLVDAADRLYRWLAERYPSARWLREWPISEVRPNGQRVAGEADLVGILPDHLVVIDHKATAEAPGNRYAGQVKLYGEVLARTLDRAAATVALHLPLRGECVVLRFGPPS